MVHGQLTNKERATLFALLALARPVSNVDLREAVGFDLTGQSRLKLVDLKLVGSELVKRRYVHELTDAGWRWCTEEMVADRPHRGTALDAALYLVLRTFRGHLDRERLTLADVFGTPPSTEARIRAAYTALAAGAGDSVDLADVRDRLGGIPRAEVDAALVAMERTPAVHLTRQVNQKVLTQRDHDAALVVGGVAKHRLAITG